MFGLASPVAAQSDRYGQDPNQRQDQPRSAHRTTRTRTTVRTTHRAYVAPVTDRRRRQDYGRSHYSTTSYRTPRYRSSVQVRHDAYQPPDRNDAYRRDQTTMPPAGSDERGMWSSYRTNSWGTQHRGWSQRGGYSGYRIPEDRFTILFGAERPFRLSANRMRIAGQARQFESNGFWFTLLEPVPEAWSDDWYDTDSIQIVEQDGGYYMVDASYPDDLISVSVEPAP
jgi:hypothetical protein